MSAQTADDLEVWDVWDLPPIGEMRNVSHDNDYVPTEDGQVRCYFDGTLMRSILECDFSVGFDGESPVVPYAFVFHAPVAMWPDEQPSEPSLETMCSEENIPIVETDADEPNVRVFEPAEEVSWDFEIRLETTPYEVDDAE